MNLLLFGTPEFSVTVFRSILNSHHKIAGIVTQPDGTGGRGLKLITPKAKIFAIENNLTYFQPESLKEPMFKESILKFDFECMVVVAYGNYIPSSIFSIPPRGTINIHPSLLPKYRGAAPINWSLMNGDKITGVTFHKLVKEMDAGDIILQKEFPIEENDNALDLLNKLSEFSALNIITVLDMVEQGNFSLIQQDHKSATFAPMMTRDIAKINWNKSALSIHNLVRALLPWPVAFATLNGEIIKFFQSELCQIDNTMEKPGKIIDKNNNGIAIQTGDGVILAKEIQRENRNRSKISDFLNGYKRELNYFE